MHTYHILPPHRRSERVGYAHQRLGSCSSASISVLLGLLLSVVGAHASVEQSGLYLPLVQSERMAASAEQTALARINHYRLLAGVPPLRLNTALQLAAQHHAQYVWLNADDTAAWMYGPHGEVLGKPGFTGATAGERVAAAGYLDGYNGEVMAFYDDAERSVDELMQTVFHRINILTASHRYLGYGHGHTSSASADVFDFGRDGVTLEAPPHVIVYPVAEQVDVPLYGGSELPSPASAATNSSIGFPITLQSGAGNAVHVRSAALWDTQGSVVTSLPNPEGCAPLGCYALIPRAPLLPATRYTAHVAGDVDRVGFDLTWSFTTTTCLTPGFCV